MRRTATRGEAAHPGPGDGCSSEAKAVPSVVLLRTIGDAEDDSAVHIDLAMGEPDTERGRTPDSESGENAEEYIDLAMGEHDAERDSTAAGAPIAYIDLAKGPAESPVAFIGLALSNLEKKLEVALTKRVRGRGEDGDSW
jgi:hypothetical protein